MRRLLSLAFLALLVLPQFAITDDNQEGVSFARDVAPSLVKHCQACHGDKEPKGGYQLYTFELLNKPGDSDAAPVKAANPAESELYRLITIDDKEQRMPKE